MLTWAEALNAAIEAVTKLRRTLRAGRSQQVTGSDERALIKSIVQLWFTAHRSTLQTSSDQPTLTSIDVAFRQLLEFSDKATSRSRYLDELAALKDSLVTLRSELLTASATAGQSPPVGETDQPPDFSQLVPDATMRQILERRWHETLLCRQVGAHLAATVMMGALLEALLLARVNATQDKSKVFRAAAAPKDKQGKSLPLGDWTLRHYIDVAHELQWIRQSGRDVGEVLRDYRNYIHPAKELSHNVDLNAEDTDMFWAIFTSLVRQILAGGSK